MNSVMTKRPVGSGNKAKLPNKIDYGSIHAVIAMANVQLGRAVWHFLQDNGVGSCVMTTTAQKAVEHILCNKATLFFVDYELPDFGGVDFVKFLRICEGPVSEAFVVMVIPSPNLEKVSAARDGGSHEILGLPLTTKLMEARLLSMIGNPKPFIRHPAYTGPCRRREVVQIYHGEERRGSNKVSA